MRAKKHRTAAQKAATRKLVALNRAKRTHSRKRRANPIAEANPVQRARRRARRAVAHVTRRTRRRNPIGGAFNPMRDIAHMLQSAAIGAGGAIAVDLAVGRFGGMLPAMLTTGNMRHVTRAGVAVTLAAVLGKIAGARVARDVAQGSLTVIAHDAALSMLAGATGVHGMGYIPEENLGFLPSEQAGMGDSNAFSFQNPGHAYSRY